MAHPTAPCCEIRTLVLHTYPDGIKAFGHGRINHHPDGSPRQAGQEAAADPC